MSDDNTLDENPDIRVLREKAARADAAEAKLAAQAKDLMFAKAGIDTSSTLGKMLYQTFDGDDPAKLVEQATEIGLIKKPEPPKDEPHPDAAQQATRQAISGGDAPNVTDTPNPWDAGYEQFYKDRSRGLPREQAQLKLAERILSAAAKGDPRVRFDKRAHQEAAALADEMAML